MEKFVYSVYGFWFWLTRKYRAAVYNEAAEALREAHEYLLNDYVSRASTIDRGTLLPIHLETLDLLERHSTLAAKASGRFDSITECYRFITEELSESPVDELAPIQQQMEVTGANSNPISFAALASFLTSEESGSSVSLPSSVRPTLLTSVKTVVSNFRPSKHLHAQDVDLAA